MAQVCEPSQSAIADSWLVDRARYLLCGESHLTVGRLMHVLVITMVMVPLVLITLYLYVSGVFTQRSSILGRPRRPALWTWIVSWLRQARNHRQFVRHM